MFYFVATALGLVGGAPRVADSSAGGACRFFRNSMPPSKQNRLGKNPRTVRNVCAADSSTFQLGEFSEQQFRYLCLVLRNCKE